MTPLALAADLEAKHKAIRPSMTYADRVEAVNAFYRVGFDNLPTLLTALRESGEVESLRRAWKESYAIFVKDRAECAEIKRALKEARPVLQNLAGDSPDNERIYNLVCDAAPRHQTGAAPMSVEGRIIEMKRVTQRDADNPEFARDAIQIWVVDRSGDETIVFAKPQDDLPEIGSEIWWQGRKIYFAADKKFLWKLGYSTGAPR